MNTNVQNYSLIESVQEAGKWFEARKTSARIAFDLEADGLFSYEDSICLAQVAAGSDVAVIDPVKAPGALEPLAKCLTNPQIVKIAHGSDYDIRLLKKRLGISPANIFDTMIAAQLAGDAKLGLAALIEEHFGVLTDKKHQRADWSKRPLTRSMLDYAALDVAYLVPLADIMKKKLEDLGRLPWAEEEFRLLEAVAPAASRPPSCFTVKGAQKLKPRELGVLQALLELRDIAARKGNRPPFKVLLNQTLLDWAKTPPKCRADVVGATGVSRHVAEKLADGILKAVEDALALEEEKLPRRERGESLPPLAGDEAKRLERLKMVRAEASAELNIDPGILVNTATLEKLARMGLQGDEDEVRGQMKKWQWEAVGAKLSGAL